MRRAVAILFFLSGACTLVYELVWTRLLVLVFGTSVLAVSTVLACFMAGLALGGFAFGRWIDRRDDGLRVYAWLELGIGLFALALPSLLARLDGLYTAIYRSLDDQYYLFALARFAVLFLVLLVPTTLMGGTLPVLVKTFVGRIDRVGVGVGLLYAVNTFGAVVGCFLAAFVLIDRFGTRGATYAAAATNVGIALVSFLLYRVSARGRSSTAAAVAPDRQESDRPHATPASVVREPVARSMRRLVLFGFALSGFAALGYEVLWSRLLTIVLQITTLQSLSLILITFLTGLAVGGSVAGRLVDRWRRLPALFGGLEVLLGLFGLVSIAAIAAAPAVLPYLERLPSYWGHNLRLALVIFGVMIGPTFVMGLLFPLAGRIYVSDLHDLGASIGRLYAANTVGAILGAFLAGFVLIPALGTQGSLWLLAWVNVGVGVAVIASYGWPRRRLRLAAAAGSVGLALVATVAVPSSRLVEVFRGAQPDASLLYFDEALGGTVTVHATPRGKRILRVNGAGEVPTDLASLRTFRLLGSLPMLLHPDPEEVLIVAYGGGITLAAAETYGPRRIDCVEVVPNVVAASRYFADYNNRVFERVGEGAIRLIGDDGRNHVLRTERRYDVIISDSTHPSTADSWILYTEEFYRLCRARLAAGGLVAQWVPLHGLTGDDHRTILRTFRSVFPHATLWLTRGYSVLLATPEPLEPDLGRLVERLATPESANLLYPVDLDDPVSYLSTLALDETAYDAYAGDGPINTDDRPRVSLRGWERVGSASGVSVLAALLPHLIDRAPAAYDGLDPGIRLQLSRRLAARTLKFHADLAIRTGNRAAAAEALRQARRIDPGDRGAARMLRNLGVPDESPM